MYGLPTRLVSDNGPQFASEEFAVFMKSNGVKHIRCAPYHPSSNRAAEHFVQAIKASRDSTLTHSQRLYNFLLTYRITTHSTTNEAPCKLFMGRVLRTRWDLLKPDRERTVTTKQTSQKESHDIHACARELDIGETVMAWNPRPGLPAVSGIVKKRLGPLTYLIETTAGFLWKQHIDHLRSVGTNSETEPSTNDSPDDDTDPLPTLPSESSENVDESNDTATEATPTERRYPQCEHRLPLRYRSENFRH